MVFVKEVRGQRESILYSKTMTTTDDDDDKDNCDGECSNDDGGGRKCAAAAADDDDDACDNGNNDECDDDNITFPKPSSALQIQQRLIIITIMRMIIKVMLMTAIFTCTSEAYCARLP